MYVSKNASGGINPPILKELPSMESLTNIFDKAFVENKLL